MIKIGVKSNIFFHLRCEKIQFDPSSFIFCIFDPYSFSFYNLIINFIFLYVLIPKYLERRGERKYLVNHNSIMKRMILVSINYKVFLGLIG
jgi:hypothetical protein